MASDWLHLTSRLRDKNEDKIKPGTGAGKVLQDVSQRGLTRGLKIE